ncbi:MAG: bifunctional UDP-N-acetylglucosamine diphosphorylase/glucosamine-1-phosphate N-acetyltransferase GlmU [Alphaproteobacteria bacterium]|nr:bifunctional UDP-N-acetylglucosamine diphosphorylase/glucosamine-1-phosphate N-acetyltransferase GlmU [Alphaproteobacteria bacterium]
MNFDSEVKHVTSLACIILAAGKGSRMKSVKPKVLHELAGRPMIRWLIERVEALHPEKIVVVVGPDMQNLEEAVRPYTVALQKEQRGTADAAAAAMPLLGDFAGRVLILMGDEPLVPEPALRELAATPSPLAVMGIIPDNPTGLGRMILVDDGHLERIVEEKDASEDEKEIMLCNGGNYCVDSALLRSALPKIGNSNAQGEYYLTDIVDIARREGFTCEVVEVVVDHVWGINSRAQLAEHERILQRDLREGHMAAGATLLDPATVYFSWDTQIGRDVTIGPSVFFGPGVSVADNAEILPFCHLEGVRIGNGATVGPFARLRPGSVLEEGSKVGNFVELKKVRLGKGSKANHLTYLGDADIGERCNIGAGTIFCNYDGVNKHRTKLGDGVFIGSNSTLVAPITIDDGAYVAAGSVMTKDVPADALAVARNRPIIREGWAKNRREKLKKEKG